MKVLTALQPYGWALIVFWLGPVVWFVALLVRARRRDPVDEQFRTAAAALAPDDRRLPCDCWVCAAGPNEIAVRFRWLTTTEAP